MVFHYCPPHSKALILARLLPCSQNFLLASFQVRSGSRSWELCSERVCSHHGTGGTWSPCCDRGWQVCACLPWLPQPPAPCPSRSLLKQPTPPCSACTLPTPQGHGPLLGDPPGEKPPLRFPPLRLQSQQKPLIFPTVGFAARGHRAGGTWELLSSLQHHCWRNEVQVK